MLKIKEFNFTDQGNKTIREIDEYIRSDAFDLKEKLSRDYLNNWPTVYIIRNTNKRDKIAYIGETTSISNRIGQHLKNPDRLKMNKINIIFDDRFNKSAILDIESFLIKYMSSIYNLQNGNEGLKNHDYYGREDVESEYKDIWKKLMGNNVVNKEISEIENKNIFKYSPYKELSNEQQTIINEIVNILMDEDKSTIMLKGASGTGKTIIGIYILKLIKFIQENTIFLNEIKEIDESFEICNITESDEVKKLFNKKYKKIGYVVPLNNLRGSIISIFKKDNNLDEKMVITPLRLNKKLDEKYDLLIVDEMHRLKRPGCAIDATTQKAFTESYDPEATQLDWILKNSKSQIFMYDINQRVRGSDITREIIEKMENESKYKLELTEQMRCKGGKKYIRAIKGLLNNENVDFEFKDYEFKIYDDPHRMIQDILELDDKYKLCRTISGIFNDGTYESEIRDNDVIENVHKVPKKNKEKIVIGDKNYLWNIADSDWINSADSRYQIGCIHTIQGCDLNYAGVILGDDITYNKKTKKIEILANNNSDYKAKVGKKNRNYNIKDEEDNILDVYYTLLTRGIRGTYVYATNKDLRDYLKSLKK